MLYDGIRLSEGSEAKNLVIATGTSFPSSPDSGELFYRTDGGNAGIYVYDGFIWQKVALNNGVSPVLPDIISPGTYRSVTVNTKGLVANGTNPTTLAGYGITDAVGVSHLSGGSAHPVATTSVAGFMSAADKVRLDNTYHTGNLVFGSGLSYSGGQLTVTSSGGVGGTIANQQIAFGNGTNISGAASLIYDSASITIIGGTGGVGRPTFTIRGADSDLGTNLAVRAGDEILGGSATNGGSLTLSAGNSSTGSGYRGGSVVINAGTSGGSISGGFDLDASIVFRTAVDGSSTLSERFRILHNGSWSIGSSGNNVGLSGQVLTSNGAGTPPSWQNQAPLQPSQIVVRVNNTTSALLLTDAGGSVIKTTNSAHTWSIPTDGNASWGTRGNVSILVCNDSTTGNVTIAPQIGVTLFAGLSSGSFILAPGESRLLHRTGADNWRIR